MLLYLLINELICFFNTNIWFYLLLIALSLVLKRGVTLSYFKILGKSEFLNFQICKIVFLLH